MPPLPPNVRVGRNGRIGILKKVPRDLWSHPRYVDKSKVIERSTGTTDRDEGVKAALAMLNELDREFSAARRDIAEIGTHPRRDGEHMPEPAAKSVRLVNASRRRVRSKSPVGEASKREILFAAMQEFAEKGLKGARVDDIAAKTRTTKPMIYYHFGSKERLYGAVMEEAYVRVREKEQGLHLDDLSPEQAMQRLVEVTFDHHAAHSGLCEARLRPRTWSGPVTSRSARHWFSETPSRSKPFRTLLERGERDGVFRSGLDPWHVHFLINSFCFMRVSNRYTWNAVFEKDLWDPDDASRQRQLIIEAVLRYVKVSG